MTFIKCRECGHQVSKFAHACPGCGVPHPADAKLDGFGYEYKSKTKILGYPLLHVSFKYGFNNLPVPAVGIIAIGQVGIGIINITQFGVGLIGLGQFIIAPYAIAQFAFGFRIIAQIGVYIGTGIGQSIWKLTDLLGLWS